MKQSESSRPDRGIDHEIEERSVGLTRAAGVQNGTATAHRTTAMDLREEIVPLESLLLSAGARNDVELLEMLIHHDY